MTDAGNVVLNINDGIAEVVFSHPKSNSLPGKLLLEIANVFNELGKNHESKVIILRSEGEKAFCAGASFDELLSIEDFETGKEFFMGFARVINAMRKCPQFIIGIIHGKAVGGGVGLASAVDYCFAHTSASAKLSELALGIGPFVVGPAVERKIGKSAFGEMSIDYDWRDSNWCREKGLYNKVFETSSELDKAVSELAEKLSNSSPEAMASLKRILWDGTEDWDKLLEQRAEVSGKLVLSEFTKNYIKQFKQK